MKGKLLHLTLLLFVFFTSVAAVKADGLIYVGYCDSSIATDKEGHVSGLSGNDADIDLAIRLPRESLSGYVGCKITAVHFGLPAADTYPTSVTGWVRSAKDGANIVSGTKSALKAGWNNVPVGKGYTITGQEEELWVGVRFRQATKMPMISFAGPTHPDGAWISKNGKWSSYASENWGSLSVEAVVEGNVPTHNLSIYDVKTKNELMKMGDSFVVTGSIKNLATQTAVKPYILCTLNGLEAGRYTIEKSLAYLEATDFSITVPTTVVTEEGPVDCQLTLCWADGTPDQGPDDNVAHLSFSVAKELFYRKMVVEEGTGTWCGWCVYGIVGLREMKRLHPDDFIGIAIHSGDAYEVAGYTSWINKKLPSGFPGCINNRVNKEELPRLAELQAWYAGMPNVADAGVWLTASVSGTKITFETETRFYRNISGTDYRMVFVVTENKIPVTQKNFYTGNARGEMGGFENLPGDCHVEIDDVARGIYPAIEGQKGGFPANVESGVTYYYRCTTDLPKYSKAENLEVVALLLDGKTGEIVQADKTPYIYGLNAERPDGIEELSTEDSQLSTLNSQLSTAYDLQGRRVANPANGQLYIKGRRVYLNK